MEPLRALLESKSDKSMNILHHIQVARMPRLIQQDFSEERRGVGGGREGCDGGTVGRKKERGEWEWEG